MGEYVKHQGQALKLGTCEDLYYVTFPQAKSLASSAEKLSGNLPPAEYVNPKLGWRYRFPFPEEDGTLPGAYEDFDKGRLICLPPGHAVALDPICHDEVCVSVSANHVFGVNVFVPCPASEAFKQMTLRHSPVGDTVPVEIVQQKLMDDRTLWTVLRCGWCGKAYRIPLDEARQLCEWLRQYDPHNCEYWAKVADRIEQGYGREN